MKIEIFYTSDKLSKEDKEDKRKVEILYSDQSSEEDKEDKRKIEIFY